MPYLGSFSRNIFLTDLAFDGGFFARFLTSFETGVVKEVRRSRLAATVTLARDPETGSFLRASNLLWWRSHHSKFKITRNTRCFLGESLDSNGARDYRIGS